MNPEDPAKIPFLLAFEETQKDPQSWWLNEFAPMNIWSMLVTLDTSHLETSQLNDLALANMARMSTTLDTSQFEMSPLNLYAAVNIPSMSWTFNTSHQETSPLKDAAPQNMLLMAVTRDTSHLEMSPTNDVAPLKIQLISFIRDMRHFQIGPFGPSEQAPSGDNFRQFPTAVLSSASDRGLNRLVLLNLNERSSLDDIDTGEPSHSAEGV